MAIKLGIRTHFYDRCVAHAYHEWRKLLGDDVFLLVDETRGRVDVDGGRKLSWKESDAAALALPMLPPKRVPWYNGDYHIYHMIPHMEENDFCYLVEHDVFLRVADSSRLLGLLKAASEYDFVAVGIGERPPQWQWLQNLEALYDDVKGALVMIVGFNKRTAEYLLERRIALNDKRMRHGSQQWPFVEAFIGTELCHAQGIRAGDLKTIAGMTNRQLRTNPPFLFEDLLANAPPDSLFHPCLSRERFIVKIRVLFRKLGPNQRSWSALMPFVSTANEAEMDQLNELARTHWGVASLLEAFPEYIDDPKRKDPTVDTRRTPGVGGVRDVVTDPTDVGPMLALFVRMQQELLRRIVIPDNTPDQKRQLTSSVADLFHRLLEIIQFDFACEVGAHEGTFARRAKQAMPDARVIAFEANPTVFDMHRRNLETAGVEFHQLCVADRPGTTQLKVPLQDSAPVQPSEATTARGGQSSPRNWPGHDKAVTMGSTFEYDPASRFELFECETVSLDGFLDAGTFRRGALWVDVEGAASRVFEGAERTLENCSAIYVELENRTKWAGQKLDVDVYRHLFKSGFVPVVADCQKSWQYNVILLRQSVVELPSIRRAIFEFLSGKTQFR